MANDKQVADTVKKARTLASSRIPMPSMTRMERIRPITKEPVPLQRNMKRKSQEIEKAPVIRAKKDDDVEINDTFAERLKQSNELVAQGQLLRAQVEIEQLTAKMAQNEKREKSFIARIKRYTDTIKTMQQQIEELTRSNEEEIKQKNEAIQLKNEADKQKNLALKQKNELALRCKDLQAELSMKEAIDEKNDASVQTDAVQIQETKTFEEDLLLYQEHEEVINEGLQSVQKTTSMLQKMLDDLETY